MEQLQVRCPNHEITPVRALYIRQEQKEDEKVDQVELNDNDNHQNRGRDRERARNRDREQREERDRSRSRSRSRERYLFSVNIFSIIMHDITETAAEIMTLWRMKMAMIKI